MKLEDKHVQNQLVVTMLYKHQIHSAVSIGLKIWMLARSGFRKACFLWQSRCMKAIKAFLRKTNLEGYFVIHWLKTRFALMTLVGKL